MDAPTAAAPQTLVVAARSARLMAEAATRDGYRVIALDTYGDVDTRRACARWLSIGAPGRPIDAQRTLDALASLQHEPGLIGWVAGSDFECEPELLLRAARQLRHLGTAPADVARVRDPALFFGALDALGLAHPELRFEPPVPAVGWLRKHARGSGGWHIRHADAALPATADRQPYYQREQPGVPMSALFVGNGQHARLVGVNELIVRPLGALPHVYRGAVGPVQLPVDQLAPLNAALDALTAHFALRGLASLDFVLTPGGCSLLEINPRPSSSLALYGDRWPLMHAHVEACCHDQLPLLADHRPDAVRGTELLLARRAFVLDAAKAAALAARRDCHDLPAAGSRFAPGDPVCTLSANGASVAEVRQRLDRQRRTLRDALAGPAAAANTAPVQLPDRSLPSPESPR